MFRNAPEAAIYLKEKNLASDQLISTSQTHSNHVSATHDGAPPCAARRLEAARSSRPERVCKRTQAKCTNHVWQPF